MGATARVSSSGRQLGRNGRNSGGGWGRAGVKGSARMDDGRIIIFNVELRLNDTRAKRCELERKTSRVKAEEEKRLKEKKKNSAELAPYGTMMISWIIAGAAGLAGLSGLVGLVGVAVVKRGGVVGGGWWVAGWEGEDVRVAGR